MRVKFNIKTNFRGTVYNPGDEADMDESGIKLYAGKGSDKKLQITVIKHGKSTSSRKPAE